MQMDFIGKYFLSLSFGWSQMDFRLILFLFCLVLPALFLFFFCPTNLVKTWRKAYLHFMQYAENVKKNGHKIWEVVRLFWNSGKKFHFHVFFYVRNADTRSLKYNNNSKYFFTLCYLFAKRRHCNRTITHLHRIESRRSTLKLNNRTKKKRFGVVHKKKIGILNRIYDSRKRKQMEKRH